MDTFGTYLRKRREALALKRAGFSLRKVASMAGIQPSYLSKIERDQEAPPGEETIKRLAAALEVDADMLLAMGGKVSSELQAIILKRPELMSQVLQELKKLPQSAVLRLVREVRDGNW
ncbi:MAG: helix-turn-helix domain-containing protein [Opitutales bacterium]|nr:helix-turn-helix domain-containing protein [Opitutales bacterium]